MRFFVFGHFFLLFLCLACTGSRPGTRQNEGQEATDIKLPVRVHSIRAYGGDDERNPPILVRNSKNLSYSAPFASSQINIEFDVNTDVPPSVYLSFTHCDAMWREDNNVFISDVSMSRTSSIDWQSSPYQSSYYTYRGRIAIPNLQIQFKASGNWKAKIFEYGNDTLALAETRFFVVDMLADCDIALISDFYEPRSKVSPASFSIEAMVYTREPLFENQLHTVVVYRNNRWHEPLIISRDFNIKVPDDAFNYGVSPSVYGSVTVEKRFRIDGVPAQNDYRVLDLSNTAQYPGSMYTARLPLPDLRRNGSSIDRTDDGAFITRDIFANDDEYINMEFLLDPENFPSRYPVYLVGSFNNWEIRPEWQMYYDKEQNYYRLRQWVRRARHNYLYATGRLRAPYTNPDAITFEEFEGNTLSVANTFLAFVYYRDLSLGGYDAIIALGAANPFGQIRR